MINLADENLIPPGWEFATISDLIAKDGIFVDGDWIESKDQDQDGEVRLIQLADIGDGNFKNKSARFLTSQRAQEIGCTFLNKKDILIARMPDPLGRACIFPLEGERKYVTAVDVCIVRLNENSINEKYLTYLINSPALRKEIESYQTGSTRKRISRGNLAKIQFPIAPLNEQHRIVAKIEELFSELDKGVESLKVAREQLKVYRQVLLKHAFEGKLTEQWRKVHADQLETADQLLARIKQERERRYQQQLADWEAAGKKGSKPKAPKALSPMTAKELAELPELPMGWGWFQLADMSDISGGLTKNQKRNNLTIKRPFLRVANVYANKLELDDMHCIGIA